MTTARIAPVCLMMIVTSVPATAQQRATGTDIDGPPERPASTVVERTSPPNALSRSRLVQTRRSADGRESVVDVLEVPGLSGTLEPVQEVRTETVRTGPSATRTSRELVEFVGSGRRVLVATTESSEQTSANGSTQGVESTRLVDVNGRLGPTFRQVASTRSATPSSVQSQTTVAELGTNGVLAETERTEHSERRVGAVVSSDTTQLLRDLNGRWQPSETRKRDARTVDASEQVEEEAVERRDSTGKLTLTERNITRRSTANGRDEVLIETYAQDVDGYVASQAPLQLTRRVRRSTTTTADGGRSTVEEVEARSIASPGDPLRVVQRAVINVRRIGSDRWLTERQVFERDVNGRMSLAVTESEETTGK